MVAYKYLLHLMFIEHINDKHVDFSKKEVDSPELPEDNGLFR